MKIGIIGAGIVGGALANYFQKFDYEVVIDDPPRGINGDCKGCDAIFVCVPVDTVFKDNRIQQDLTVIKSVLNKYRAEVRTPFFIRSTVLPKTTDHLRKLTKLRLYAMPEFLTEREADETFANQDIICGADIGDVRAMSSLEELLDKVFPNKTIALYSNREVELAKYSHNVMGALKVNFFNLVHKYAQRIHADYDNVLKGVLMSGYINKTHTMVPGPDGKKGFAGKCFPKDTLAFIGEAKRIGLQVGSLECMMFENMMSRVHPEEDFPEPNIAYRALAKVGGYLSLALTNFK